jgi:antitoxin YefM
LRPFAKCEQTAEKQTTPNNGRYEEGIMAITATAARKDFYRLIEKVNLDHDEVGITSKSGSAFLVSARDYNALRETAHLLRSPANAARLAASAQQVREGHTTPRDVVETDEEQA